MVRKGWFAVTLSLLVAPAGAAALDDPMRPPNEQQTRSVVSHPQLQLTAVMIHRDRRIAVINGQRVREGSQIAGSTVLAINPSTVTLRRNGRLTALSLLDLRVKTISKTRNQE
ncbi:general secretion pathway protein GspB [Thiohalomonas denitrificans]|uniref:MSHA biogenesis protein MshK n=1 Tax=Thiohalomonas denitrificans TaxID=415747 RepID=A0A1G5QSY6_9GAMM|nr:general secretion pathway protein GspB [Thiohalomonas denitrificans]SCZ64973.1 MSHA biogenesis protein MshK [Thiohalomonas denitrificans]